MNKKQLPIYLIALITIAPLWGMNSNKSMLLPAKSSLISNEPKALTAANRDANKPALQQQHVPIVRYTSNYKDNYPYLVNDAYKNKELKTYAMEQFVFNQDESISTMNAAKERGANIYLTVGAHAKNKMNKYNVTNLKKDANIHGKLTVGLDQSPSKVKPETGVLLFGSANTTNSTWRHRPGKAGAQYNFESGIEIKDDMDIVRQAYAMVKSQSPMKSPSKKITIQNTPEKISIYGSKDTNLNKSLALRLGNAADRNHTISLRTMSFNNQDVADQLSKCGSNADLIVDYSALTKNGIPLLQQLTDSKVSVSVFHPDKGSRAKQHAKDVIIESENKNLYINSTANITAEGDQQRNYQLYIPNNQQVIRDAKEDFAKVKKESITLEQALELKNTDSELKTKKRKLKKTKVKKSNTKSRKFKK